MRNEIVNELEMTRNEDDTFDINQKDEGEIVVDLVKVDKYEALEFFKQWVIKNEFEMVSIHDLKMEEFLEFFSNERSEK